MTETLFSPVAALQGGALIGLAAVMLMAATGRIAGTSGMAGHLLPPYADRGLAGRLAFLLGLVVAPLVWAIVTGRLPHQTLTAEPLAIGGTAAWLFIAAMMVGMAAARWLPGRTITPPEQLRNA